MEQLNKSISVENLIFSYNRRPILNNVNIDIESEKLTFILGQNGSGKSTFLRILAGLLSFQKGHIKVFGKESTSINYRERSKLFGFLNQQYNGVFPFSVEDVVLTGRAGSIGFIPKPDDMEASVQSLQKVGISHLRYRNYTDLSGGEQQLVMIARLLAQNPKILLLDEPTIYLDLTNQAHLFSLLRQLVKDGLTIIAVVHDPNLAFMYGDDFIFLKDQKVFRSNEPGEAWDPEFLKTVYGRNIRMIPFNGRGLLVPYTV